MNFERNPGGTSYLGVADLATAVTWVEASIRAGNGSFGIRKHQSFFFGSPSNRINPILIHFVEHFRFVWETMLLGHIQRTELSKSARKDRLACNSVGCLFTL